jgi:anti-sigma factor RsiW
VGEDDLEAYVDGRLSGERLEAAEALLAANPALLARLTADRALRTALRERLAGVAAQPIPSRLRVGALVARRRMVLRRRFGAAVAAVMLLAVGLGTGWAARGWAGDARVLAGPVAAATDAIQAHRVFVVETVHPVEVAASQQAHLVQWLSRRVGHRLTIPDLSAEGFELMGGRVIPEAGQAAAQFMYQDGNGHRLTLMVRQGGGDTRFRFVQADRLAAFSWVDDGLSFAMVASVERPALLALAEAAYHQLDPASPLPR